MTPRLTIAIPTYNRATLLRKSLESALAQTASDIVILVSDNGSTDGTQALLAEYSDSRLQKIRREVTVSRAEHGALIYAAIETEFLLILSDDDWLEPDFAREVIKLCDEHPELSFLYTGCIEHYDDAEMPAAVGPRIESSLDFFAAHYAGQRQVSWCACVTRARDLRDLGPQPADRMMGDMYFWTKIGLKGPIGCVSRRLSHYSALRPAGDNESRSLPILAWGAEARLLAEEVMHGLDALGVGPEARVAIARDMGHYTTRSIANQFLWGRISGMSRAACLRLVWPCLKFKGWTAEALVRLAAAIILPRAMSRKLVVGAARKKGMRSHPATPGLSGLVGDRLELNAR